MSASAIRTERKPATIKGVFVRSHIRALREAAGKEAVLELERRYGAPLTFGSLEDVPVRDEVRIIELALDLTSNHGLTGAARAEAAGRLHFANFSRTTLGSVLMSSAAHTPQSFISLLRNAPTIAHSVFGNTEFSSKEHRDCVVVTITNCDYPLEHFAGFFAEWMRHWGLKDASVQTRPQADGSVEYWLYFAHP
jgi:uncharacterized protein (TIGR02265 family)